MGRMLKRLLQQMSPRVLLRPKVLPQLLQLVLLLMGDTNQEVAAEAEKALLVRLNFLTRECLHWSSGILRGPVETFVSLYYWAQFQACGRCRVLLLGAPSYFEGDNRNGNGDTSKRNHCSRVYATNTQKLPVAIQTAMKTLQRCTSSVHSPHSALHVLNI